MKILYGGGFTETEVRYYKDILLQNTLIGIQELVKQVEKLELQLSEENRKRARLFAEISVMDFKWDDTALPKIKSLWDDKAIQQAWEIAPEFQLQMTTLDYHMQHIDQYASKDYIPTNNDMLRARFRTTGMVETVFEMNQTEWTIIDTGGQLPERAKWKDFLLAKPNGIIFFTALDEFNMVSVEDSQKTKMQVAMQVFKDYVGDATSNMAIILFLNKVDLFKKKIVAKKDFHSFQQAFPNYKGAQNVDDAASHVTSAFLSLVPEEIDIFSHVTCALDTEAMDHVFNVVKTKIFINRMHAVAT